MRRRPFNLAAAVSLVLSIATTVLWLRSYVWRTNLRLQGMTGLGPNRAERTYDLSWNRGSLQFGRTVLLNYAGDLPQWRFESDSLPAHPRYSWEGGRLGFVVYTATSVYDVQRNAHRRRHFVQVPFWSVVVTSLLIPSLWLRATRNKRKRQWRLAHQRCVNCGYDLRATPQTPQEGGALLDRCPECGTQAKPQAVEGAAA